MNVDQILRHIGEFGAYQKGIYTILNLLGITHGIRMLIAAFMVYVPKHRCAIPSYPNDTYSIQSPYHAHLVNTFIPNDTKDENILYDQCQMYASGGYNHTVGDTHLPRVDCHRWVYDTSVLENTAVVEFDMVCSKSLLGSHSQMSQMAGFLFGVLFFGSIGDRFGRKVAMYLAILMYTAAGLALSWSPLAGYGLFVFLRFVNGACSAGAFTAVCVLSVELVGPGKRIWVGVLIHLAFSTGAVLVDLIGYFARDWFFINIIGTSPILLSLSFWWIIPESPRWLAKKGRVKEAEIILRKIAKYNGKTFPDDLVTGMANGVSSESMANSKTRGVANGVHDEGRRSATTNEDVGANDGKPASHSRNMVKEFFRMFTFRVLLIRSFVLFLNWFAISMAYYGLSFTASQLAAGDLFTNFLLAMSMDFPASVMTLLLLDRWGRRPLLCLNMVVGGAACLLGVLTTMVVSEGLQWMTVVVAMVGKMGSSAGFILIYIYSSELNPTTVRSAGMGISSAFARVGSILASYVQEWSLEMGGDLGHALPLLVFGAFSLTGGVLALMTLPETLHKDLPDTVEDALVFGKDPSKDEHVDPEKQMEVYTLDKVQVEMETFQQAEVKTRL